MLTARGALLANTPYSHQYPHCWRSKTPVIFRAMDQWFICLLYTSPAGSFLDTDGLVVLTYYRRMFPVFRLAISPRIKRTTPIPTMIQVITPPSSMPKPNRRVIGMAENTMAMIGSPVVANFITHSLYSCSHMSKPSSIRSVRESMKRTP